jgi:hypothetical protein
MQKPPELPDLPHQLAGVVILPLRLRPGVGGQVAPEGQHVFNALAAHGLQLQADALPGGADAAQMRQSGHAVFPLHLRRQGRRVGAGAAAGTVGDAEIAGMQGGYRLRRGQHALVGVVVLGGKDLEGEGRLCPVDDFCEFHLKNLRLFDSQGSRTAKNARRVCHDSRTPYGFPAIFQPDPRQDARPAPEHDKFTRTEAVSGSSAFGQTENCSAAAGKAEYATRIPPARQFKIPSP